MKIRLSGLRPNKVRGFYLLLRNFSFTCLENEVYIVPKEAVELLKREKILFKVMKNNP